MAEFTIKTSVKLDTSDAEARMKALVNNGKDMDLTISMDKIISQLGKVESAFKKAFTLDGNTLGDFNKVLKVLKEFDNVGKSSSQNKGVNNLVSEYKDLANTVDKLKKQLNKGGLGEDSINRTSSKISELTSKMAELKSKMNTNQLGQLELFDTKRMNKGIVEMNSNMNKLDSMASSLKGKIGNLSFDGLSSSSANRLKDITQEIEKIQATAKEDIKLDLDVGSSITKLKDLGQEVDKFQRESKQAMRTVSTETKGVGKVWGDFKQSLTAYTIGDILGDFVVDSLRGSVQVIRDMDKAFTNLKKVAEPDEINTVGKLDKIRTQAISIAKDVGMSSSEVINATASTLQAGIGNMQESIQVARQSMILANVGDMSQEMASSAINTVINSYGLEPLKKIQVEQGKTVKTTTELTNAMDMLNFAGNNYAIGTDGLATALQNSGSVLSSYGVSLGDSIGLITSANEAMQDPLKVSTGLKSIAINMAGIQTSAKDGSLKLNKTAQALSNIAGIDIYSDKKTGQVKNMVTILDELQGKWKDLSDDEQKGISNAIAGKQNANVFQSLMGNYDTFKKIQSEFNQGLQFGSAEAENAQYVDSIEGKLNKLKETWTSIGTSLLKSDFIKGALEGFNGFSEGIDKVIQTLDKSKMLTPAIAGIFGGLMATKYDGNLFGSLVNGFKSLKTNLTGVDGISNKVGTAMNMLGSSFSNTGAKSKLLALGTSALNFALGGLAVAGITVAIKALDNYINRHEIASKKHKENITTLNDEITSMKNQKSSLGNIAKEYDSLSNNSNKTAEQLSRFKELKSEIANIMPELVIGYDSSGDPILKMNGSAQDLISSLDTAIAKKQQLMANEQIELGKSALDELTDWNFKNLGTLNTTDDKAFGSAINKIDTAQKKLTKSIDNLGGKTLESWNKNAKTYRDAQQNYADTIIEEYGKVQTAHNEIQAKEADVTQGMIATWGKSSAFNKAKENIKQNAYDLAEAFNLTDISKADYSTISKKIQSMAEVGKITPELSKFTQLQKDLDKTGDYWTYEKEVKGLTDAMSKQLGVGKDTVKNLTEVSPVLKTATSALDAYLMTFEKREQMRSFDFETQQLSKQFEAFESLKSDLTAEGAMVEIGGKIQYDPEIVSSLLDTPGLPPEIQNAIKTMAQDGMSGEEVELLVDIATAYQMGDTEEGKALREQCQERADELLGEGAIDVDNIKVKTNFELDSGTMDSILSQLDGLDGLDKEISIGIKQNLEQGNIDGLMDTINSLPEEKQIEVMTILGNSIGQMEQYKGIWDTLVENSEVKNKLNIEVEGEEELKSANEEFNNSEDDSKTQTLNQEVNENGDIEEKTQEFNNAEEGSKEQTLNQNVNENANIEEKSQKFNNAEEGTKDQTLNQNVNENGDMSKSSQEFNNAQGGTKTQTLNQEVNGEENIKSANDVLNKLPKEQSIMVSIVQSGTNFLDSISNWINSKAKQNVNVSVKVTGKEAIDSIKSSIASLKGNTSINFSTNASSISGQVNSLKSSVQGITGGTKSINFSTNASAISGQIRSLVSASQAVPSGKGVNFTSNASSIAGQVRSLSSAISSVKGGKSINFSTNASSVASQVRSLAGAVSSVGGGRSINFTVTTTYRTVGTPTSYSAGAGRIGSTQSRISKTQNIKRTPSIPSASVTPLSMQSQPINDSNGMSMFNHTDINPLSNIGNILDLNSPNIMRASATSSTSINTSKNNVLDSVKYNIELLQELKNRIDKVNSSLSLMDKKAESAIGKEKIKYIEQQNNLYKEQMKLQTELTNKLKEQQTHLKNELTSKGFVFNADGNLTNYEEKLLAMENEYKRLKDATEKAQKAESDYSGKNKKAKTNLSNATKKASEAEQKYGEKLSDVKDLLSEYMSVTFSELPKASEEWQNMQNSIDKNMESIRKIKQELKNLNIESTFTDVITGVQKAQNDLDLLDNKIEISKSEKEKNDLLKQRINLIQKLKKETEEELEFYEKMKNQIGDELSNLGFEINGRDIKNLVENMERLKETLPEDEFERINKLVESFIDLIVDKIPDSVIEVEKLKEEIWQTTENIKSLEQELKNLNIESTFTDVITGVQKAQNDLDLLDAKIKNASTDEEKITLLKERLSLVEKLNKEMSEELEFYEKMKNQLGKELEGYGFKIVGRDIKNLRENLNKLKESLPEDEFERINKLVESFVDLIVDKIPDTTVGLEGLKGEISDVEDEITEIIKKQVEERKKQIEEYYDKQIEGIKKLKEEYNKAREEQDYNEKLKEQQEVIAKINADIEKAKRDTSVQGQKKLKDLLEKLEDENKKLKDLTQNRIDDLVNDMYDSEIDRLEDESKKAIEEIENQWSDSNIYKLVKEALESGDFNTVANEIANIQNSLLKYGKETDKALEKTGKTIKNELVDNLTMALDKFKDLSDFNNKLALDNYSVTSGYTPKSLSTFDISRSSSNVAIESKPTFYITSNGDVDYNKIQTMIDESNETLIDNINKL